jgi:hypothetical protein
MPTAAKSYGSEPRNGSPACGCTRETYGCSIHPNTPAEWIASMRASLARTLAEPAVRQESEKRRAVASTVKSSASLAWFDRESSSWKTSQQSLETGTELFSETWPRSGMTLDGFAYELPTAGHLISETDGGSWPTPGAQDKKQRGTMKSTARRIALGKQIGLEAAVKFFPTPTRRDFKSDSCSPEYRAKRDAMTIGKTLPWVIGGNLNPTWVEWLMAWPLGWTVSKHWATDKCRSKPRSRGESSQEANRETA